MILHDPFSELLQGDKNTLTDCPPPLPPKNIGIFVTNPVSVVYISPQKKRQRSVTNNGWICFLPFVLVNVP